LQRGGPLGGSGTATGVPVTVPAPVLAWRWAGESPFRRRRRQG
jgi:hypothetical protein